MNSDETESETPGPTPLPDHRVLQPAWRRRQPRVTKPAEPGTLRGFEERLLCNFAFPCIASASNIASLRLLTKLTRAHAVFFRRLSFTPGAERFDLVAPRCTLPGRNVRLKLGGRLRELSLGLTVSDCVCVSNMCILLCMLCAQIRSDLPSPIPPPGPTCPRL